MATLEIGGRRVEVGDAFLKLSPEDQQRTVDEIATSLNITGGPSKEAPDAGRAPNAAYEAADAAASGFNDSVLARGLGWPVDIATSFINDVGAFVKNPNLKTLAWGQAGLDKPDLVIDPNTAFMGTRWLQEKLKKGGLSKGREGTPDDYKWAYNMGDAVGSAVPAFLGFGMAARAPSAMAPITAADSVGATMVKQAAQDPRWVAQQMGATVGAAQGGAIAGMVAPDSELANVLGQVGGSIMSPMSVAGHVTAPVLDPLKNAARRVASPLIDPMIDSVAANIDSLPSWAKMALPERLRRLGEGAEARRLDNAARALAPAFAKTGEDPAEVLARLSTPQAADEAARGFLPAEVADSPTLIAVQQQLAAKNPELRDQLQDRAAAVMNTLADDAGKAAAGGDVTALSRAARNALSAEEAKLADEIAAAQDTIQRAVTNAHLIPDAAVREAASIEARKVLDEAWRAGRTLEKSLWSKLDLKQEIAPTNFKRVFAEIDETRLLPGESLPEPLKAVADLARSNNVRFTAEALQNTRSRLLDLAKGAYAGSNPDFTFGSIYNKLAGALLDDLSPVAGAEEARAFSRALHDRWTRTFAGLSQQSAATGADRLAPAQTLERAMTGNPIARGQNLRELEEATTPLTSASGVATPDFSPQMRAQQETFLRQHAASAIVDPQTGAVNPRAAARYVQQNEAVLNRFPDLRRSILEAAEVTGAQLDHIDQLNRTLKVVREQSAFAKVLKAGEDPTRAVQAIINGPNPSADMKALAAMAKAGGDDAARGLFSAAWDVALNQAMGKATAQKGFWQSLDEVLNSSLSPKNPSLMETLSTSGVLNTTERAQLQQIVQRAVRMEKAFENAPAMNDFILEPNALALLIAKAAGAGYMQNINLTRFFGAHPLMQSAWGAKMGQKIMDQMPRQQALDVLSAAVKDYDLMRKLMMNVKTVQQRETVWDAIRAAAGATKGEDILRGSINYRFPAVAGAIGAGSLNREYGAEPVEPVR
ncbi:hypothetical protein [Enterovirga aerilata]|uniref:Uncharacterized protein n=1 Tax=Enterovirga aerilata TaxID=2730920 RepID=A0A849IE61_9HYPH|nr:hypothetical protein [Enterovirga sp. DB1703]NNM74739.1 hypothetical protein [Enterovirga sp. DB1703]